MAIFVLGFVTGFGLIVAIGAQNAFVIRQGIQRNHVFLICLTCTLIDALLIIAGVAGLGGLIAENRWLTRIAAWGGATFLIVYGALAAWNGLRRHHKGLDLTDNDAAGPHMSRMSHMSRKAALATTAAFSLLNPHVYLDTVVMLGGIGAQLPSGQRFWFAAGATVASFLWFFAIGFGAQAARPLFQRPIATRALDLFVALVMALVAAYLISGQLA